MWEVALGHWEAVGAAAGENTGWDDSQPDRLETQKPKDVGFNGPSPNPQTVSPSTLILCNY